MPANPLDAAPIDAGRRQLPDPVAIVLLAAAVAAVYGARLDRQPIVGEESRYATGAREMLATGDWVVPRQQGRVFPERPPLTMWTIALAGWLRGEVDAIAVRLPSVLAVVLATLLVYGYARALVSQFAAIAAALAYATMGQVLQIGRLGESEALFTLLVSASLLVWHVGYLRGWPALATWLSGFGFAALAALVKGPQAPFYFVAISGAYLVLRRDWRYALRWEYLAGAVLFAAIVSAWQIPFYLATDWPTVVATWSGLVTDRLRLGGLARHMASYPLETFACLLPWSPLLVALVKRETRELLGDCRAVTTFLFTALVVAYPTVWTAAGARGRYFMPLYPIIAVLVGLVIERCSTAPVGRYPRAGWHQFLLLCGLVVGVIGAVLGVAGVLPAEWAVWSHQPRWFSLVVALVAMGTVAVLWACYRMPHRVAPLAGVSAIAAFAGLAFAGAMVNVNAARWSDPAPEVAALRRQLPPGASMVSLSPIEHRFAYYYELPIEELDWPHEISELPQDVDYFCFMRTPGDTTERRAAGRGRSWTTTPGTLPFLWEEVATVCVERRMRGPHERRVVLGRVVRPLRATVSDVTVPQAAATEKTVAIRRR